MPGRNVSYVYLHTFSNGKCYVGITQDLAKRWREHHRALRCSSKNHTAHYNAWRKYGEPVRTILHTCDTWEQACELEIAEIKLKGDYNLTLGGDGTLGINRKGIKASYYGKGMHVIMDGVKYVSVGDALKTLGRSRGGMGVKRKLDKYGRCTSKIKGVPHYFEVVK